MIGLGQQFRITRIDLVGIPDIRTTWNQFDEHGLTLSLPRLRGESNADYKHRLMDVMVHRANSTYTGLVYGITRELGEELFYPIEITPVLRSGGKLLARDPYVEFSGSLVRLYSDYTNGLLDLEIDRWEPGGNYEHLGQLVTAINSSTFFRATLRDESWRWTRSMTILNQVGRKQTIESGQASTRWQLEFPYVCRNTPRFRLDSTTFLREYPQLGMLSAQGDYHLDYDRGVLNSYALPGQNYSVEYWYTVFNFRPVASPIIVSVISDEDTKRKMFEQVLLDDGTTIHGLPTILGVDLINELLSVTPLYWGI